MKGDTNLRVNRKRLQRLSSCLKSRSVTLTASLIFVCVLNYCDLQSNNGVDIFAKALEYNLYEEPESDQFLYYGSSSVFSNLSRGLPVDAEVPSTEAGSLNEQEQEQRDNPSTNGQN